MSRCAFLLGSLCAAMLLSTAETSAQQPVAVPLQGEVRGAHDPSLMREGNTWYALTTGRAADGGQLGVRCSTDRVTWRWCGHVFRGVPAWIRERSPLTKDLWAPDISHEHEQYRLYYSYSAFGRNTSGIALATATTLDAASPQAGWKDEGPVLDSTAGDDFNAIDPNYVEDADGRAWLVFGSFWSGIKLRALDAATGKLSATDTHTYALAARAGSNTAAPHAPGLPPDTQAIEAPFLVRHGGWYYLFVSWDLCCRGANSTYRTMVGRAKQVIGPYVDRDGTPMLQGGGTELLRANAAWVGAGGASVRLGSRGEPDLMVFHAYSRTTGAPSLQLSTIAWVDGWPQVALAP